jgi:hypothetical protein
MEECEMPVPMRGPVDTNAITLIAGGSGEPLVKDRKTGEQAMDARSGKPLYVINLLVLIPGEEVPQVWRVKLTNPPQNVQQSMPVKVAGLMFAEWTMRDGDRTSHGVSFRAESVEPLAAAPRRAA